MATDSDLTIALRTPLCDENGLWVNSVYQEATERHDVTTVSVGPPLRGQVELRAAFKQPENRIRNRDAPAGTINLETPRGDPMRHYSARAVRGEGGRATPSCTCARPVLGGSRRFPFRVAVRKGKGR
jgi:hypothetical protein